MASVASPRCSTYWDSFYTRYPCAYGVEPNRFLRQQAHRLKPGMRALVVGDGEGRDGVWLARHGLSVVSVDFSAAAIRAAKDRARRNQVSIDFQFSDLLVWAWPLEEFDFVVSIFLHLSEANRQPVHRHIVACLKPGGLLLLEAFHQRSAGDAVPEEAACLYTPDILARDFESMAIEELLEGTTMLDEGVMHQGEAEVVRLIARKTTGVPVRAAGFGTEHRVRAGRQKPPHTGL